MSKPKMMLWLSDSRGVYIPRDFAKSFADRAKSVSGVSEEDWNCLEAGPDGGDTPFAWDGNESYWDVWASVCDNAIVTDEHGVKYRVYQDGDCWLIPDGMVWDDETDSFRWEDEIENQD